MRTDIVIRRCDITDAEAIKRLSLEALGYEFSLEHTAEKLKKLLCNNNNLILVAELNGEVIGYVHAC